MQSWGWAGEEACCPNHSGCQSRILPLPSAVLGGPERLQRLGELSRRTPHLPSISAPSSLPPASPQPRRRAVGAGGSRALTFVTVMQELGALPGAGSACGGDGRGPPEARAAAGRGPARLARSRAPAALGALPTPGGRLSRAVGPALRAGSAQGPLVGARPPLFADVSPKCAFIIDEPLSPQEGEAGRKGARERARAGGRGEEEGPGARYKGGGGGRRGRRKRPPARCRAPRLRPRVAGRWAPPLPEPGPGAEAGGLNPFRPADAGRLGERGPGTCWPRGVGGSPGSQRPAGPGGRW